jgi:DNA-directed RNA polymerase subunit M/transcription elongation factor TFIIS
MLLYIIIAIACFIFLVVGMAAYKNSKCPKCGAHGLKFKSARIVKQTPVALVHDASTSFTLYGNKIEAETVLRCSECGYETSYRSEKVE